MGPGADTLVVNAPSNPGHSKGPSDPLVDVLSWFRRYFFIRWMSLSTVFAEDAVYLLSFGQKPTRRKVGEGHKCGIHSFDEFAMGLRFIAHALPIGVVAEGFPVGVGCFAARMAKDIDQSVVLLRFIEGRPIGHAFESVLFKKLDGVIAEAG